MNCSLGVGSCANSGLDYGAIISMGLGPKLVKVERHSRRSGTWWDPAKSCMCTLRLPMGCAWKRSYTCTFSKYIQAWTLMQVAYTIHPYYIVCPLHFMCMWYIVQGGTEEGDHIRGSRRGQLPEGERSTGSQSGHCGRRRGR